LATAIQWVGKNKEATSQMATNRNDSNNNGVKTYFNTVIDWVSTVFTAVEKEMRGIQWGRLYETYRNDCYESKKMTGLVRALYGDEFERTAMASLGSSWMASKRQNFSKCASLMKAPRRLPMLVRQR
jgi:hypothetical protein